MVTEAYLRSIISEELLNGLLANQGTYDATAASDTLAFLIEDAEAKVLSACWQAGVRSPGAPNLLRAIAGAMVIVALYARQGQVAPQEYQDAAAMRDLIKSGDMPIPDVLPSLVDGAGGVSISDHKNVFGRGKVRF